MLGMYDAAEQEKHESLKSTACFLTDYSVALLTCGTTTIRIEKNVERIAQAYGMHVEITILPLHIMLTLWDADRTHSYANSQKIKGGGLNFYLITQLSRLSWEILSKQMPLDQSRQEFQRLLAKPRLNKWLVLLLVGLANASFCHLFQGDWASMAIVFIATIDGFYLKNKLHGDWHWDIRITTLISAFAAAAI